MADAYTSNLTLTKPEVGGSVDTWGTKANANFDKIDAVFSGAGNGTSVGINVGSGKTAAIDGTMSLWGTSITSVESIKNEVGKLLFPIGSIYSNYSDSTNPNTLLGFGTWVALGATMLAGYKVGDAYFGTPMGTGGSTDAVSVTHGHTATSSTTTTILDGGHSHPFTASVNAYGPRGGSGSEYWGATASGSNTGAVTANITASSSTSTTVASSGESGVGKNLPPFTTVYLWRRTA